MRLKRATSVNLMLNLLVGICALILAFPLVWIVMMSLKQQAEVMTWPPTFLFSPTLENFRVLFDVAQAGATSYGTIKIDFLTPITNSVVIALGSVIVSLLVGSLPATCWQGGTYPSKKTLPSSFWASALPRSYWSSSPCSAFSKRLACMTPMSA
ncbi:hypothetical protein [Bradyrhizobium sp. 23]|uniref:hypothetical protein n=1 Tax=Bradyrhizobium sp. 23 TaxID=2782667 RepID=UPI001FFC056C